MKYSSWFSNMLAWSFFGRWWGHMSSDQWYIISIFLAFFFETLNTLLSVCKFMYSMNVIHYDQWTTCSSLMMTIWACSWNCYQRPDSSDDVRSFGTSVQLSQFQAIESWIQLLIEMLLLHILSQYCRLGNLSGNGSLHAAWTWVRLLSYKTATG